MRALPCVLILVSLLDSLLLAGRTTPETTARSGDGTNLGVSSVRGAFSLGGQTTGHTKSYTYDRENDRTEASVTFGGQARAGAFKVTIYDALGQQVYTRTFSADNEGVTEGTDRGAFGEWKVHVAFQGSTGNVGLSVYSS